MSYAATAGSSAAVQYSILANAVKASGAIVRVSPLAFSQIISKNEKPLIIYAPGGFLAAKHQYISAYKGLTFFTKSNDLLNLPSSAEIIRAEKIWIPS